MLQNTTAFVSLENIGHNLALISSKLKKETKILAAVKADAYGHGAVEVSKKLYALGVRNFGVATLSEALEIRSAIPDCEILIFGFTHPSEAKTLCDNNITQALYGLDFAKELSQNCKEYNVTVKTHLAFDTGMGRIGFKSSQEAIEASFLFGIEVLGAFTHFSCADSLSENGIEYTKNQYKKFCTFLSDLETAGIEIKTKHCANSAAIFRFPEFQMDMVRAGIALYGLAPNSEDIESYKELKPAMQIMAPISHIKTVKAGESISYGATFTADKPMRVATIPCGYGDGYHRSYAKGSVHICGKSAKIVGRICMDQMMVDVTDIPEAKFLGEAELLGENVSADYLASLIDTINYQVTCDISRRVPRVYK